MTLEERRRLVELLAQTHSTTRALLDGINLEMRVYQDSGWRIRDILGHIATWDREVAKSLVAFRSGEEYAIPDHDEDAFNAQDILSQQGLTVEAIFEEWEQSREVFKEAVEQIPLEFYPGDLLYPWGDERGTIAHLVEMMVEHDVEHRDEIATAVQSE
jgi:hypothetical protein